jgi:translation initiation factor eIF-2B subunit alpha
MPVAAIEALILFLHHSRATTAFETLNLLAVQSSYLKSKVPNPISLSAGTDLFQRYMIASLGASGVASFETIRQHLVSNGRLFVMRAKAGRERIAAYGRHFVRDGCTVLAHGGSRVVGTLLTKAAETSGCGGSVRFKVIYVMNGTRVTESKAVVSSLRSKGVPVATISEGAVGYAMGKVDLVIVGAEGVVENGGIISRLGTYQIGILAKAAGKPFYVVAESHKFVRLYPLGQYDLPIDQKVIEFKTGEEDECVEKTPRAGDMKEYFDEKTPMEPVPPNTVIDAVDYTVSFFPFATAPSDKYS